MRIEMTGTHANAWQEGFTDGNGLSCNICAALVARTPAATAKHREWHESLLPAPERE